MPAWCGVRLLSPVGSAGQALLVSRSPDTGEAGATAQASAAPRFPLLNVSKCEPLHFSATHPSVLAWRIPGTGEPGGLPSMGSQSRTRLK